MVDDDLLTNLQKFLGIIPIFIGVELVLGVSILNKAGGAFGVLSLLTGHPLNFWQWIYNMTCLIILPFYISGLTNLTVRFKNVRKMSLISIIYTFDTLFGLLYTFYFIYFWFSNEDTNPTRHDIRALSATSGGHDGLGANIAGVGAGAKPPVGVDTTYTSSLSTKNSQSASPARELFLTVSATLISSCMRFYFNLIILSFNRSLIKQYSNENVNINIIDEDSQALYSNRSLISRVSKYIFELEMRSKELVTDFFS